MVEKAEVETEEEEEEEKKADEKEDEAEKKEDAEEKKEDAEEKKADADEEGNKSSMFETRGFSNQISSKAVRVAFKLQYWYQR
jgi:hypothetical protein